jgi:phosphatidylinositol-3-phosphatase
MKYTLACIALLLEACVGSPVANGPPATAAVLPRIDWASMHLPVYDHIVIVVEENKDYEQIIGNPRARFINQTLRAEGASLTRMYAEEHYSEGNYLWLFSGSNQGVGYLDEMPRTLIDAENLGHQLIAHGLSFKGYSEDLPSIGSPVEEQGLYARRHVPWISFANVPSGTTSDDSSHLRFVDFPSSFETLPTVAFVIPNLIDDMHDGRLQEAIENGDRWLNDKLKAYYLWAKEHNSLLILTFDENDHSQPLGGLTNPRAANTYSRNRIATIFAGAHIRHGEYPEGAGVTHVNLLRTIEAMYGLDKSGGQQRFAVKAGIADDKIITDVFEPVSSLQ